MKENRNGIYLDHDDRFIIPDEILQMSSAERQALRKKYELEDVKNENKDDL